MTHKFLSRIALFLGAAALPLMAADAPWYVSGAVINSQGDLRSITQNPLGFGIEGGFHISPADFGVDLVGHVGYLAVTQKKKELTAVNQTAKAGHFGAGLAYPFAKLPMSLEVGLVMHNWDISNLYAPTGGRGESTWKLGVRTVLTYNITDKWGASLGYTQSEFVSGVNPSYVTVAANYRF